MRVVAAMFALAAASPDDLRRAHRQTPGQHLIGDGHAHMAVKLNKAMRAAGFVLKACEDFSVQELIALQRHLHGARDPALEAIYRKNKDLGRSMRVFGRHAETLQELEQLWAEELDALRAYPGLVNNSRDTKCHEAVMWLVHHVPQAARQALRMTMPLLPERALHAVATSIPETLAARFPPGGGLGCDQAHASQSKAKNNEYFEWPEELTYTATGHGAFPFWDNGGAGCSHCDPSISNSASIKVRYSAKQNAEIILHESCGDMTWTGHSGAPNKSPCNHIFTSDQGAFIYTPKTSLEVEADGEFCCRSVSKGSTSFPGAVPRDWMKTASYAGTYASFSGDHYSGDIKMFTWTAAGLQFWYYTKPDGTPIQQGESCRNPGGKKPVACPKMLPITLYHDWQPETFVNASFSASDFAVPAICKTTSVSCLIPGESSRQPLVV